MNYIVYNYYINRYDQLLIKQEGVYTINILDGILIIFFNIIKICILLNEVSICNLHRSYELYFSQFDSVTYIFQEVRNNEAKKKENFLFIHKYNKINRGFYRSSTYMVKPGDTLFYIAWISGNNYIDLARNNNIQNVHLLQIGQVLKINPSIRILDLKKILRIIILSINNSNIFLKKTVFLIKKNFLFIQKNKGIISDIDVLYNKGFCLKIPEVVMCNNWHWPTYGKIIDTFSESERGNKGIDISGTFGQPILAATNGKVIYTGNTLQGYGNLIVIKHDNDYLSAYAHNDMILVTEQQKVKVGDKIATMGSSDSNEIKLHFEIRYKGKSVDPVYYLSKNY